MAIDVVGLAMAKADAARLYLSKSAALALAGTEAPARVLRRSPMNRAASGWTIPAQSNKDAASTPDYTTDAFFGDRCLRILTTGTGVDVYASRIMSSTFDATDCHVRITVKCDANTSIIQVIVGDSAALLTSSATLAINTDLAVGVAQAGRWATIDIPRSKFTGSAAWNAVQFVRVGVVDRAAVTDFRVHAVEFVQRDPAGVNPNGMVVLTADDSHVTQYGALKDALTSRGWKATLMPVPGAHGTDSNVFMTDAQVKELHDDYGWEVGAHCYDLSTHTVGLPALTSEQRQAEFRAIRSWQHFWGYSSPSHAYPLGTHDAATEADVAKFWAGSRMATSSGFGINETTTAARRFSLFAENIALGAAAIGAAAVKANADKGVLFVMSHAIVTSGGDANAVTPTVLTDVLDAIAASGCDVVTMGEALTRMGLA